jgi:hypothetical protein
LKKRNIRDILLMCAAERGDMGCTTEKAEGGAVEA